MLDSLHSQASTEAVLAVFIILLLAVIVSVFTLQETDQTALLSENSLSKEACEKISAVIYSLSNSNAKPSVVFDLDANASVSSSMITVGSYYCNYLGTAQSADLHFGKVKAFKNFQGVVVFEQMVE